MSDLTGFSQGLIALDILHVLHLGVMRDVVGAGFKIMCRNKEYYSGRTIAIRLRQLTSDLKSWCKTNGLSLGMKRIRKATLHWKADACPELKAKGADAAVCLRFLAFKLMQRPPSKYHGLVAASWALEHFLGCLAHASLCLTPDECNTAYATGMLFVRTYISLARESLSGSKPELLFKTRPKLHYLVHLIEDLQLGSKSCIRNPYYDSTFVDEDWIKHVLTLKKRMHAKTCSLNVLKRFAVLNKATLDALKK